MADPSPQRPDRLSPLGSSSDRTNSAVAFFTILAVVVPILFGYAAVSKRMRDAQDYSGWVFGCLAVTFFVWALVVRRWKHVFTALLFAFVVMFVIAESGPLADLRGVTGQYASGAEDWALQHLFTSEGLRSSVRSSGHFLGKAFVVLVRIAGFLLFVAIVLGLWSESIYQSFVQNAFTGKPVGFTRFDDLTPEDLSASLGISIALIFFAMVASITVVRLLLGVGWGPRWLGVFVSLVIAVLAVLILAFINLAMSLRNLLVGSGAAPEEPPEAGAGRGIVGFSISFHRWLVRLLSDQTKEVVASQPSQPPKEG